MLQRGRKSAALRAVFPQLNTGVVHRLPTPAPKSLAGPEQHAWDIIVREHNLNRAGELLLENALRAMGRARELKTIIDRDGVLLTRRDGFPKRHPLLNVEVQYRKIVESTFKLMHIHYEGGEI